MTDSIEYAEGWRPEEGETLIGEVTGLDIGWSKYPPPSGSQYPIVTVRDEDSGAEVAVHCFHAALRSKMTTLRPVLGERIGIQYKGKRASKTDPSQEVAVYVVKVQGRTADVWGSLAPAQPSQAPVPTHGGFTPHPTSDVPADASDFAPQGATDDTDDIPF